MAAETEQAQTQAGALPIKPVLEVLLLYQDLGTALRAKHLLDRLSLQLGARLGMNTRLWRLDLLSQPLLAEQAAIEASAADVVVLSLRSRRHLRAEVRDWLSRWLDHRTRRPCPLSALPGAEPVRPGRRNAVLAYFRQGLCLPGWGSAFC